MPRECAPLRAQLMGLSLALQVMQEQLNRQGQQAQEAQARAEQEVSKLQERLAAALASDESARDGSKVLQLQLMETKGLPSRLSKV